MEQNIALAPVAGWDIGPIPALGAVTLRLGYLTHATQQPEQAQQTPRLVMTAAQCLELIEALKRAAEVLRSGPAEGSGLPQH